MIKEWFGYRRVADQKELVIYFEKIMSQLSNLQSAIDNLTTQVNSLMSLTNTLHTELVALRGSVADPGLASKLSAMIDSINQTTTQVQATISADTDPTPPAGASATSSTPIAAS